MARNREKPVNPYLAQLLRERGYVNPKTGDVNLKQAAMESGIKYSTMLSYADCDAYHQYFNALIEFCDKFDVSLDDLVKGLVTAGSADEVA